VHSTLRYLPSLCFAHSVTFMKMNKLVDEHMTKSISEDQFSSKKLRVKSVRLNGESHSLDTKIRPIIEDAGRKASPTHMACRSGLRALSPSSAYFYGKPRTVKYTGGNAGPDAYL
jgi:hypothetical protein